MHTGLGSLITRLNPNEHPYVNPLLFSALKRDDIYSLSLKDFSFQF